MKETEGRSDPRKKLFFADFLFHRPSIFFFLRSHHCMRIEKLDIAHLLIIQFLESRAWLFTGKNFQQMLGGEMDTRTIISPEESRRYGIRKSLVKLVGQRRHEYFGRRGGPPRLGTEKKGERRVCVLRDRGIPHRAGECRSSGRHL